MSSDSEAPADLPRIPVQRFHPDGGCSPSGWILLQGASAVAGVVMGLLTGFISQYFYLVVLFPCVIGFGIGWLGTTTITKGKIRSPWLALVAAMLGGLCAVWGMHYFSYMMFYKAQTANISPEEFKEVQNVVRNYDQLRQNPPDDEDLQKFLEFLAANPKVLRALQVESFTDFVDLAAEEGVTINSSRGGNGKGMNLGYVGSYIYWIVELGIIAGLAVMMMRGAAAEPFCQTCQEWKGWRMLGRVDLAAPAQVALETGNLNELRALNPMPYVGDHNVSASVCPNCGIESPVEMKLDKRTLDQNNNATYSTLTTVTYPGYAMPLIDQLFAEGEIVDESENVADAMQDGDEANEGTKSSS